MCNLIENKDVPIIGVDISKGEDVSVLVTYSTKTKKVVSAERIY